MVDDVCCGFIIDELTVVLVNSVVVCGFSLCFGWLSDGFGWVYWFAVWCWVFVEFDGLIVLTLLVWDIVTYEVVVG